MDAPRSLVQRIADTRARLEHDLDSWVATATAARPWLVPLTHLWSDGELLYVTDSASRTARNVGSGATVRVSLGHSRDVVIVDGRARSQPIGELGDVQAQAFRSRLDSDPRTWADVLIRVRPTRVQAWREENELAGRLLMRDGQWLVAE